MMRSAISPRFAIKTFSNIEAFGRQTRFYTSSPLALFHPEQNLAKLHRLAVFRDDLGDGALGFRFDFVHDFHRLDDADDGFFGDFLSDIDEWSRLGRSGPVKSAYHRGN